SMIRGTELGNRRTACGADTRRDADVRAEGTMRTQIDRKHLFIGPRIAPVCQIVPSKRLTQAQVAESLRCGQIEAQTGAVGRRQTERLHCRPALTRCTSRDGEYDALRCRQRQLDTAHVLGGTWVTSFLRHAAAR